MNSSFCCTCAGTCCHTGPHMYCEKHMGSALRVLADIVLPCPSCSAKDARIALLEKAAEEYRFALIFYAAQANYIVAGEGMNWVIADQGARARAALDALKEGK